MSRPTYEDLQAEVWDLRWRLERAEQGDQSRDVVPAQAFLAMEGDRDRCREALILIGESGNDVAAHIARQAIVPQNDESVP